MDKVAVNMREISEKCSILCSNGSVLTQHLCRSRDGLFNSRRSARKAAFRCGGWGTCRASRGVSRERAKQ